MKTEWNYTDLADAYLKRPEYAETAIDLMIQKTGITKGAKVCDIGAGAAHLTLMLARRGFEIVAVEPNDAMRANGIKRTNQLTNIRWFEGVGENTGQDSSRFDLVTFGSSFNVCNQEEALIEANRILKHDGWFSCMWNHRELSDALQQRIEDIIKKHIPDYSYGTRRKDQTEVIDKSGLFQKVEYIEDSVTHAIKIDDFIDGWKSHGTLHRQSKEKFEIIIDEISEVVTRAGRSGIVQVPYTTRIWVAKKSFN